MTDGVFFWGYKWAYGYVPTLAVWCAGLDCGDHPVDISGFVFVPWGSDADGLFTPDHLIALSTNPPKGGFGASACSIDIQNADNVTTRVVVDLAIGIPYNSRVQLLRPNAVELNHSQYGPSLAETRRLHQFGGLFSNTGGLSVGTDESNLRSVTFRLPNGNKYPSHELYTGVHWDVLDCAYDYDGMLMMEMFRPYPATIAALIGFMKTMDRA